MDLVARLRAWTYARQRLGDPASTLEQALRAVVAVYATHPTAPLALRVRSKTFTAAAYRRLDAAPKAIRIPAMRKTVFLVPYGSAARIFTAAKPSAAHALRPLKRLNISLDKYEEVARRILARAKEPIASRYLEKVATLGGAELSTVLRCLRYEGRLLTIAGESLNMSPHRYVATEAWLPEGLVAGHPDGPLAWLAGEYLRAYGPARVADFAWWTGTGKRAAAKAIEAHDTIELDDELKLLSKDERAFSDVKRLKDTVTLLPKWDAYTMGFAPDGRERLVHPEAHRIVYTPIGTGLAGDGNPVVLVDGEAVATWTFTLKEGPKVQPFDHLGPKTTKRVDEELDAIAGLLRT